MVSLVRSGLLRMIAFLVVFLPVCVLVAHVYTPYDSGSNSVFTFRLSLTEPVQSPHEPVQSRDLPPVNRMAVSGTSVVAGPSLSADFLNRVLASAGSPAAGTGQALADLSRQYHIDDAYDLEERLPGLWSYAVVTLAVALMACPMAGCAMWSQQRTPTVRAGPCIPIGT